MTDGGVSKDAQGARSRGPGPPGEGARVHTHSGSGVNRLVAVSRSYMDFTPAQQATGRRKAWLSAALAL